MHHFLGDPHLSHHQVLKHDKRPFASIEEHDEVITERCRPSKIEPYNELWLMGDVAWTVEALHKFMAAIRPRWDKIHLIRGNHDDKVAWRHRDLFDSANEALYLRIDPETKVYLSHYAHRVWRNSHHGAYHVHGHSHGCLPEWGRSIDSFVGDHNWGPISMADVVRMRSHAKPFNHHDSQLGLSVIGENTPI